MGTGFLTIQTRAGERSLPIRAHVTITPPGENEVLYEADTDESGNTERFPLTAPDKELTLDSTYNAPAYSVSDVHVSAPGYKTVHIHNVEIVDTQTAILPVDMIPLEDSEDNPDIDIDIDQIGLLDPHHQSMATTIKLDPVALLDSTPRVHREGMDPTPRGVLREVFIPDFITVHLGVPTNAAARNVRVRFVDYIKNVTSSEIYSTWPQNSLLANIHAIVSFTLNRVYTEWYRIRGFNFDITNSTAFDQAFRYGGPIFENISRIVDGIFNVYARRIGFQNPFFTSYCNGTTATCAGLSQWGTVPLANQGLTPLQILHRFYPNDLELVETNNVMGITESFPGTALRVGSRGASVQRMQNFLNRIRINFPLIPRISTPNGVFDAETQAAVRAFQNIFNLSADGVIGRETWNRISFINVAVTRLAELDSEGTRVTIGRNPPNVVLRQGSRGEDVLQLQFLLNYISEFYPEVPGVIKDSVFGADTRDAVIEFQRRFGLTPDGVVGPATWNKFYAVYRGITENAPIPPSPAPPPGSLPPYPGTLIRVGSTGPNVRLIQGALNTIRRVYTSIPQLAEDGIFGPITQSAVIAFQREFVLTPDGIVGPITWAKLMEVLQDVTGAAGSPATPPAPPPAPPPTQPSPILPPYPGTLIRRGSTGANVRLIQSYLNTIRMNYPNIPQLVVDGVFGPITQSAVTAFQREFGLNPDGIVGPLTWGRIMEVFPRVAGSATLAYPGTLLRVGSTGRDVRLMQTFLMNLRPRNPSIPQITVDGIFGPNMQAAVAQFQRLFGLNPDGIIGPLTWSAIVTQHSRF